MMTTQFRISVLTLVVLVFTPEAYTASRDKGQGEGPVDVTLTRKVDFTGDGHVETVTLRVRGRAFYSPFHWSLKVTSNLTTLHEVTRDDADLDEFFGENGYMEGCSAYEECKRKYYFEEILANIASFGEWSGDEAIFDAAYSGSVYQVADRFLRDECRLAESRAREIHDRMVTRLKKRRAVLLIVPRSPVLSEFPMMYIEEVQRFVPVYEW